VNHGDNYDNAVSNPDSQDRQLSALPSPLARAIAFAAICIAGLTGGAIGYSLVDVQCSGDCQVGTGFGLLLGSLIGCHRNERCCSACASRCWRVARNIRPMTPTSAIDALGVAKQLARAAGDMALAGRKAGLHNVQTKSTGTDMVTEFDRASEAMIFEGLRTLRPLDSVVGEEGAAHSGETDITWYIDPIDGTTNFLYALPNWAVSIGAADKTGPLAGVVYIPALDEMFTATRGGGAFLNDQPIRCNDIDEISQALVCTGLAIRLMPAPSKPNASRG
jgi:hypothetical protein